MANGISDAQGTGVLPVDVTPWSEADAQRATPQAAFRSYMHALETGNVDDFAASCTPAFRAQLEANAAASGVSFAEAVAKVAELMQSQGRLYLGPEMETRETQRSFALFQDGRGTDAVDIMTFEKVGDRWLLAP